MSVASSNQNLRDVDERVIRAVDKLSRQDRLTVADVAATAGVDLSVANDELVSLANLTGAAIDVTDTGSLAYRFPRDVRGELRRSSLRASIRMTWERAFPTIFTAVRIGFGALLIISIVVTFVAIAALSSASRSDDDRRGSRPSSSFMPVRLFAPDIFDIMFYTRQRRYYSRNIEPSSRNDMSFLEAVYSFVFGDGDPNEGLEDSRWRRVAAVIRANRGAVTAEQLAPFLDTEVTQTSSSPTAVVDESFVLPALQRFQGHPEVTNNGDIIYVFPSFSTTGSRMPNIEFAGRGSAALDGTGGPSLVEKELTLTRAPPGQRAMVVALGLVNVLGVLTLGAKLATVTPLTADAAALVGLIRSIYPALAAYAASFIFIPLARFFRQRKVNSEIKRRNKARATASVLASRPDATLRAKMAAAEAYAQSMTVVKSSDVIYSSDKDVLDQKAVQENFIDDFDRRLNS